MNSDNSQQGHITELVLASEFGSNTEFDAQKEGFILE